MMQSTCNYSQASESAQGDWNFTCGSGPAAVTVSPNLNGSVCESYGAISEDVNGNWTISGCVSAAPTVSLDAPVTSSSTYPSNVPFTLKATATASAGRTISSVEFFHDGVSIHAGTLSGTQYTWDWAPPSGTYQITARATDNTGAITETSPTVQMIFASAAGSATIYYIHPDHLGTPREITRASDNQVVWRWDNTEPFGSSQPDENPNGVGTFAYNLRFPGQYFDGEAGTNYNYFRDYDPGIGRYVESDPEGIDEGLNTFSYVENNPLSLIDPLGLYGLKPRVPQPSPALNQFLICLDGCMGTPVTATSTTDGKHQDPGHAGGTSVDVRKPVWPGGADKLLCCGGKCGAAWGLNEGGGGNHFKYTNGSHIHFQMNAPKHPNPRAANQIPPGCKPGLSCTP